MARSITLTLGAGLGADLGPNFNLTADVGSVTPSTATKTELTAGKSVSVDDAATQVTVTSTGTCTNAITQTIPCAGGTTTTTTTTTEAPTTTTTTTSPSFAIVFINNSSLDVPITDVTVNGVSVTWGTGANFPVNAGENGSFETTQLGTYNIQVFYGVHTSGQNVSIQDSDLFTTCCNINGAAGSCIAGSSTINLLGITITAGDGNCN